MATCSSGIDITKVLLLWPMPIADRVADLFTMTFVNLSQMIKYISEDITKTDIFHLIIPLDCPEDLLNDPVYEFPQVRRIDIYYDETDDLAEIQHRFNLKCGRLQFGSVHDLPRRLESIEFDNALVSSDPIDRNTIYAIISSIKDRIAAKRSIILVNRSELLKQFAPTFIHGFPVKDINEMDPCYICPSCKLLFQQPYQLECRHRKCKVCLNIRKSCTICSTVVSPDKAWFDQGFQISMQNLRTVCLSCDWKGTFEVYEEHLRQNHRQLFTRLVRNLQIDHDSSPQSYLIETDQQIVLDNLYHLSSYLSMTSLNGTCIWEVSGIGAMRSHQPRSIYSSPFYLFPNGYKICLRFFLNGDTKARGTHMSLFFVLMRGNYDAHLQWPFKFRVKFTLFNHLSPNDNQSKFFWPDTKSICFQRPRGDMNIGYGISNFVSLDLFETNQSQYVEKDTVFVGVQVDFLAERTISSSIDGAGELPHEEENADRTYDNLPSLLHFSDINNRMNR